jgi:hypothetical protein
MTGIKEELKEGGMQAGGCLVIVALLTLCGLFIKGMVWISDKALPLPWLLLANADRSEALWSLT